MNILITINRNYLNLLNSLLFSIQKSNKMDKFYIYILNKDLTKEDIRKIGAILDLTRFTIIDVKITKKHLDELPMENGRYPVEIYFRLFAVNYLPKDLDRILYLDTDIIVINELKDLYNMNFEDNYFIATTHVKQTVHKFNEVRLGIDKNDPYINTGMLLINLKKIREETDYENSISNFIKNNKKILMLPDQDILSMMYGNKTKIVDEMKYNLGDRALTLYNMNNPQNKINLKWICKNTVIIHYYGKNKPYNKNYIGKLGCFYYRIEKELKKGGDKNE